MRKQRQTAEQEEESEISDDSFLNAVHTDLRSVDKTNDNRLLIALLLLVPLALVYERSGLTNAWADIGFAIAVTGIIGYTIRRVIREKQRVARKYGLICPVCGYKPMAQMVLSAATTQRCTKCGARLDA